MAVDITPIGDAGAPVPRYSGKAVLALPAALLAVFLPVPFGMLLGGSAMLLAGSARRELKRDATVRGSTLALLGFLLGAGVLVVQAAPLVLIVLFLATSVVMR